MTEKSWNLHTVPFQQFWDLRSMKWKKRKKKYFVSHAGFEPTTPLVKRPNSHLLSSCAPKCRWVRFVGFRNTSVSGSSPEPSVNVDGLQVFSITTFSFEVALSARSVDWAHVIWNQKKKLREKWSNFQFWLILKVLDAKFKEFYLKLKKITYLSKFCSNKVHT